MYVLGNIEKEKKLDKQIQILNCWNTAEVEKPKRYGPKQL